MSNDVKPVGETPQAGCAARPAALLARRSGTRGGRQRGLRGRGPHPRQHLPLGGTDAPVPVPGPARAHGLRGDRGAGRRRRRGSPCPCPARAAGLCPCRLAGRRDGTDPTSSRAAARARTHASSVDRAVREAAGLDPEPPEEWAEVLRFVARMTDAAERRDSGWVQEDSPSRRCAAPSGPCRPRRRRNAGSPASGSWPGTGRPRAAAVAPSKARAPNDRCRRRHRAGSPGRRPQRAHLAAHRRPRRDRRAALGADRRDLEDADCRHRLRVASHGRLRAGRVPARRRLPPRQGQEDAHRSGTRSTSAPSAASQSSSASTGSATA